MANMYGPTEAAVDCLSKVCEPRGGLTVPIGRPVSNMRAYLLDERMEPVPQGVVGELYIGGVGLARGYFGRPDLTAERFVPDPVSGIPGSRLYRTGDLARGLSSGELCFLGRVDHQVKVRGMRIELGEIEAALAAHERVDTALIVQRSGPGSGQQLVAYVVTRELVSATELRAWLSERLPAYMLPAAFVSLSALPLTPSGKVDRRALPEPEEQSLALQTHRPPRTPTEQLVASVFSELLGRRVGVDDDFFALGGHSLLAIQAICRLRAVLGVELPLRALFEAPTVSGLARATSSGGERLPPLEPAPEARSYPLSSTQRGVWFACQVQKDTRAYNMAAAYLLEGELEVNALEQALQAVVQRHEILRTTFFLEGDEPRQRVAASVPAVLERDDLSAWPDAESLALARCRQAMAKPFDLEHGPLLRALLMRLGPRRQVLLFNLHHIIFDAWSTRILIREALALYEALVANRPSPLAPPRLQYRDYTAWEARLLAGDSLADSRNYWHRKLTPLPPALGLPTDRPRSKARTLEGAQVHFRLDAELTPALRRLAREAGATVFMTLQAAIKVLLFAYTGQRDLTVGTLTAGRFDEALEDQMGLYLGTLVLRDRLNPSGGFLELLAQVKRTTLEAFDHPLYPYERLVQELQVRREPGRQPLFDVLVNMMDAELTGADLNGCVWEGLAVRELKEEGREAKFDLTWYLFDRGEHVEGTLEYSTDLFEPPTMERMVERFQELLRWLVERPHAPLAEVDLSGRLELPPVLAVGRGPGLEPLSPHQERLWFIDQFERGNVYPHGPTYHNVPWLVRLEGEVDGAALEEALRQLTLRHEALRTRLVTQEGRGWQQVEAEPSLHLERLEAHGATQAGLVEQAIALALRPFAHEAPLVRTCWLRASAGSSLLVLSLHHALVDWDSMDVLWRDFAELYAAAVEHRAPRLPQKPFQARDVCHWQRQLPQAVLEPLLFFWRRELGGHLKALELPTDRPRPAIHTYTAGSHPFTLPDTAVRELARRCGCDPEATLLAAFKAVLHRWAGHDEIVVGTVHPGRELEGLADVMGPVGNLLVLRSSLAGDPSLREVASAVTRTLQRARLHGAMPFDPLVLALEPDKDMSRTALFDVLFRVAPPPLAMALPRGLRAERVETHLGWGKYDLSLCLTPREGRWEGTLVYNRNLFDSRTAERLSNHLRTLLQAAVAAPDRPISMLPLMDEAERAALAVRPQRDFAVEGGLHQRFERQVALRPGAPALVSEGQVLSYAELEERANRLARYLRRHGIGPESLVGLCLERSAEVVVCILAILKAGGAYLPLDPRYPREQLAFTVADSGARWVLTTAACASAMEGCGANLIDIALEAQAIDAESGAPLGDATLPEQAAYVLYTSGSSGRPKGCTVTHRNVLRLLDSTAELFHFGREDVFTLFHSYAFDFSVWELWGALAYGGKAVVVPHLISRAPEDFARLLRQEHVTVLNQTPSALYALLEHLDSETIQSLRYVILGGEALDFQRLRPLFERYGTRAPRLINMYGITETTVHVTYRPVTAQEVAASSGSLIGAPLADLDLLVLDRHLQPQPVGVAGELYVGGAGLARGYLGRPALTAERFVPNPFARTAGERLYRTGDLARRTASGDIEYLGRIDQQVKIHGFRIELGEIEAALSSHPHVRGAVVTAHDFGEGDRRLVAYVVTDEEPLGSELRHYLQERLPSHMVPSAFVRLEALPLTESGKVDRKGLPAPHRRSDLEQTALGEPRTSAEAILMEIWKEVLRLDQVDLHDNFFELGGDSILSIQILSRAARRGLKLPAQAIFQHPTVAELATVAQPLAEARSAQEPAIGELPALPIHRWFFEQQPARADHFNQAMMLSVQGVEDSLLERALEALVAHHDALRLRAWRSEGDWHLEVLERATSPVLERVDLSRLEPGEQRAALEAHAARHQTGLDLEQGRPLAAVLYHLGGGEPDRLLLIIHHLAVDGVSWRILAEDLDTACRQLRVGQQVRLAPQGTSLREWAVRLQEHAERPEVRAELEYWVEVASRPAHLEVDEPSGEDTVGSERSVTVRLEVERTRQLLLQAPRAYRNRVEELLLAALVQVLCPSGQRGLRVDLESHGRLHLSPEMDLGRTVGWLTVLYPVWLELPQGGGARALLESVKEQLLAVPGQGLGYGLLRYMRPDPRLAVLPASPILFNFHGRVDSTLPSESPLRPAPEAVGLLQAPGSRRTHALEVTGAIANAQLELTFSYSAARLRPTTVEALASRYLRAIEELILHCLQPDAGGLTPSDFPEAGLSQQALDDLLGDLPTPQ
jgi:amino acid adenylation domain-containing protein/non-ribosomal peptide synthase protein (TIGR01720 family)